MNHVASDTACAYSPGSTVARKIARGRQIDGGERVGQKRKGRNERKRETNWKSPRKRNELAGEGGQRRKRSGNNEEGESELKARKPCVGKRREDGEENGREKRSEKIIEDEKKRRARKERGAALSPMDSAK